MLPGDLLDVLQTTGFLLKKGLDRIPKLSIVLLIGPQFWPRPAENPGPPGLGSQDRVAAGLIHQKHGTPYVYIWGGYIWHYGEGIDYPKKTSTRTRTMKTYYWISDAIPTSCLARRARIRSHASFVRPSMWPQTKSQQGVDCMKNKIKELKKTPK